MHTRIAVFAAGFMLFAAAVAVTAGEAEKPVVVLDARSVWRSCSTLKPPVIEIDGGMTPILTGRRWLDEPTAEPPAAWRTPDFDDRTWLRGSVRMGPWTPYAARVCLRGRFEVTDPAAVKDLSLALTYQGGVIAYLNGTEIGRKNLPAEGNTGLADGYPPEAFLTKDGDIIPSSWVADRHPERLALRKRTAEGIAVPRAALRKGVNVLAIEVIRAPYNKILDEKKGGGLKENQLRQQGTPYSLTWHTCEMVDVSLTAAGEAGLVPNAGRPEGMRVWANDLLTSDYDTDVPDRCVPIRPVELVGARNGSFSGKAVVSSPEALTNLKATPGDLKGEGGVIPAAAVHVRYGTAWGSEASSGGASRGPSSYPREASMLDALLEEPLAEFPVSEARSAGGASVPVWLTVSVPKDAQPGLYSGEVTITARGQRPVNVPVRMNVIGWTMPDVQDFRTWVELMQSPESVAIEYGVPMWSERHWELMSRSLYQIGRTGTRIVYIPLIAHTNSGNEQSMLRWIKKGENDYDFDFSLVDKYLDFTVEQMGKPKIVAFNVWDVYLNTPKEAVVIKENDSSFIKMEKEWAAARWNLRGKGPAITVINPDTGETTTDYLPRFEDPAARPIWKRLFDELHKRMKERGLEDTMMLGMLSDSWPTKDEIAVLHEVSGGLLWTSHTHGGGHIGRAGYQYSSDGLYGIAHVGYTAFVWNVEYTVDPAEGRRYGWNLPQLVVQFKRFKALNRWPSTSLYRYAEMNITGAQRGVGRIGADFWPVMRDARGRRAGQIWGRYPQSLWHSLNMFNHLLAPGPNGPVATGQMEVFREGVQDCEARIFIESALIDKAKRARLGDDLAQRCQQCLDERMYEMWRSASDLQLTGRPGDYASTTSVTWVPGGVAGQRWFTASGWQARTAKLYTLAAEVEKALATQ